MNLTAIAEAVIPERAVSYTARDTMLYALGIGWGSDPVSPRHLNFVHEKSLRVFPTYACTMVNTDFWITDPVYGLDCNKILHGSDTLEILAPMPAAGTMRVRFRILGVDDKGADKGAVMTFEKTVTDAESGIDCARSTSVYFLRGDGGHGSFGVKPPPPLASPVTSPDRIVELPTLPQAALLYRLSGDYTIIHADPDVARQVGFPRPILHGLCTMGMAARGVLELFGGDDPRRLSRLRVRFTRPVFPGETIRVEAWQGDGVIPFRARAVERDIIILDGCQATLSASL